MVMFKACPIWRMPVTFGGGITTVNGSRSSGVLSKYFLSSQCKYHFFSDALKSKFLVISIYLFLLVEHKGKKEFRV
jgi:hypothetical protein